jgi:hypothetical protein
MVKKEIFISIGILLALSTMIDSVFAVSFTPSYGLDFVTPSQSNWNQLSAASWNSYYQQNTKEFLYTTYNLPSNWDQWKCDYYAINLPNTYLYCYDTTTNTIEQYLKGYVNGQWTVYSVKLNTILTRVYLPGGNIVDYWNFTAYHQLNSDGWQDMGSWTLTTAMDNLVYWKLEFSKAVIDGHPQTKVGVIHDQAVSGYYNFGPDSYFSTPSVMQVYCKADIYSSYPTSFQGYRYNEVVNYT